MLKAYKYRIYPTPDQKELIHKHIGSCRFVYNLALETKQTAYAGAKINLSLFDLNKQLPELKKECSWLKEINSQSLQQSIANLDSAFNSFFKGISDFPAYKKKSSRQSFRVPQKVLIDFEKCTLDIPKFKVPIEIRLHRKFKGTIKQATISKTPTGKYFASILVENGKANPAKKQVKEKSTIGIDLGLKSFIVTSDGLEKDNPKFLKKSISRLKFVQRKYSVYKGNRTKQKLSKLHEKVANQRKNFLHQLSAELIKSHDSFAIEDLNISGMRSRCKPKQDEQGNHVPNGQSAKSGLNKSISDAGWGMFVEMLTYKSEWSGKNILKIGRFEPSSKTCSSCGIINKELELRDRFWTCNNCETEHNRDVNAAINIKNFALKKLVSGTDTKNRGKLPTLVGALDSRSSASLDVG